MSRTFDTAPLAVIPLHGDWPSLGGLHSPTSSRESIVAAIHEYGTARAEGDLCLGRGDLSAEEAIRRIERINTSWISIWKQLEDGIPDATASGPLLSRVGKLGVALFAYGDARRMGIGLDAAQDALDVLDEILEREVKPS